MFANINYIPNPPLTEADLHHPAVDNVRRDRSHPSHDQRVALGQHETRLALQLSYGDPEHQV